MFDDFHQAVCVGGWRCPAEKPAPVSIFCMYRSLPTFTITKYTMRPLTLLLFVFFALPFGGFAQAPYQIKSCRIEFAFSKGGYKKGTQIVIFTDSGAVEKTATTTVIDYDASPEIPKKHKPGKSIHHTLYLQTRDSAFYIDLDLMTITLKDIPTPLSRFITKSMMKKIGEDTILNKPCDVMEYEHAKFWYWKGIVLKKLITERLYEYATLIDEDYIIKDDEFMLPKGVKMQ